MNDPQFQVRNAYKTALNNLAVGTGTVPFYSVPTRPARRPYIYISSMSLAGTHHTKTSWTSTVTVTLGIKQIYRNDKDGYKLIDDIANKIIQTLIVRPGNYQSLTGFEMITANLIGGDVPPVKDLRSGKEVERTLIIEHIITQN